MIDTNVPRAFTMKGTCLRERVAVFSSGAIIVAAAVYWVIQVRGVLEMLELAYG